ncbi:unnamed protein product [Lactuca saligna]|uniref:Uncharacterized protein n=1 Tax=Lactuca saligna TaxID=75948 RepID=A0AA35V488_LACSI|nr:unnamed protein product [Lactuca saligna]
MLFLFYIKYGKPQLQIWSLQKLVAVKVYAVFLAENFTNVSLKGFKGLSRTEVEFTLAYLPCMNPNDWISLFLILSKYEQKYEPMIAHLKRMLICYIHEVAKMDVEVAADLKKKTVVNTELSHPEIRRGNVPGWTPR